MIHRSEHFCQQECKRFIPSLAAIHRPTLFSKTTYPRTSNYFPCLLPFSRQSQLSTHLTQTPHPANSHSLQLSCILSNYRTLQSHCKPTPPATHSQLHYHYQTLSHLFQYPPRQETNQRVDLIKL